MNRPRISWNMEEDGVIAVSATQDDGRMFPLLDIFRQPLIQRGQMSKEEARAFQIAAAERICAAWNEENDCKPAEGHLNSEWVCPIGEPECSKSCGSYGCGN